MDAQHPKDRPTDIADTGDPIDRRQFDGEAGRGDMLGGLSAGAGGRLGPDHGAEVGGVTIPMAPDNPTYETQYEFRPVTITDDLPAPNADTDAARDDHGPDGLT